MMNNRNSFWGPGTGSRTSRRARRTVRTSPGPSRFCWIWSWRGWRGAWIARGFLMAPCAPTGTAPASWRTRPPRRRASVPAEGRAVPTAPCHPVPSPSLHFRWANLPAAGPHPSHPSHPWTRLSTSLTAQAQKHERVAPLSGATVPCSVRLVLHFDRKCKWKHIGAR